MNINNINLNNINKIPFKATNSAFVTSPCCADTQKTNTNNNLYIPDYNVKTPQKYTFLETKEFSKDSKANFYKLENGQRVVILNKKGPTIVKTYVNTGSMNEDDSQRGISHFIEHSLFNGSDGLKEGEFFETVNKIGGNTNAATGFSTTDYYISSNLLNKDDLEHEIKIHASMIETPKFTPEMIEKEKGPVTSEISMITDDSNNFAINNSIKNLYNIKSTSKDMIGGTIENINKLDRETVLKYYKENYYPSNMVTVITGDVDADETIKLVSKYFQAKAVPQKTQRVEDFNPISKPVREDIVTPKATKTHICMSFNGPQNNNVKDKVVSEVFNELMLGTKNSRLTKALESVSSDVNMSTDRMGTRPTDNTVIILNSVTSEQSCNKVLDVIYDEIQKVSTNPPTSEELDAIKKNLRLCFEQVFEESSSLNSMIGTAMLDNSIEYVTEFSNILDSITPEDITNYAEKYLDLNKTSITVVHPQKTNKPVNNQVNFGSNNVDKKLSTVDTKNVSKYLLPNNIELYTNNIDRNICINSLSFKTKEPVNAPVGAVQILNVMLNEGTSKNDKDKFYDNLYKQGTSLSVSSGYNGINISTMGLPESADSAINSIKELVLNPNLTQENFEFAKALLKDRLETISPSSKSGLMAELFKGNVHSIQLKDVKDNLDNITLDDIKELYKNIINNSSASCIVSAPFNDKNLSNTLMTELSSDFPKFKPVEQNNFNNYKHVENTKVVVQNYEKSQAQIELGYKFKTNNNLEDSVTFMLLNIILGGTASSRLFNDLRETQKLAYHVSSKINTYEDSDVLSLFIKTTTDDKENPSYDNLQKSINGFNKHVDLLKSKNVSEEELENAKKVFKNKLLTNSETSVDKTVMIIDNVDSPYGIELDNKALEIVDSITADDIRKAANYIFSTKPVLSVVATPETISNNEEYLKNIGEIVLM